MKNILIISMLAIFSSVSFASECMDRLTNNNMRDSLTISLDIDEINDRYFGRDYLASAIHYIKAALEIKGCSRDEINFGRGALGRSKSRCQFLAPGIPTSLSCYVETNLGYFFVTRDLGTKVHMTYSRWD